jgi:hypothetical protein
MRAARGLAILFRLDAAEQATKLGEPTLERRAAGGDASWRSRRPPAIPFPLALAAMLAAGLTAPGAGVAQTSLHVRGAIVESDMRDAYRPPMVVREDNGALVIVETALNSRGVHVAAGTLAAIVPPHLARAIVERTPDGTLHARVVLVFPDNFIDGEVGEVAWDRPPSSLRIQGTIAAAVPDGATLAIALRYGDVQSAIVADPATQVAVVTNEYDKFYVPGDHVFIAATRQRDGRITAGRVFFGKDGFVPPM